jgi:hypothetical protein
MFYLADGCPTQQCCSCWCWFVFLQARVLLQQGRLLEAADALSAASAGTQAADVVGRWVEAARARAVADQAVRLLQAHATTTAVAAGK